VPRELRSYLRPQDTKVDIILAVDNITGEADIRQALVLALEEDRLILAQTQPPLTKVHLKKHFEVSFLPRNESKAKTIRLGWNAMVVLIDPAYAVAPQKSFTQPVFGLSWPEVPLKALKNIRQAYRLDTSKFKELSLSLRPWFADVYLINLSSGGLSLTTKAPCRYKLNQEVKFILSFPPLPDITVRRVEGEALIVRRELKPEEQRVVLGLKFKPLNRETERTLPRILNYYMREEIRKRGSQEDDFE